MQSIQNFIEKVIENHILNMEHENYKKLEIIIGREKLEKLSFYLETSQNEQFTLFLNEILESKEIKVEVNSLLEEDMIERDEDIEKDMNPNGKTCKLFYGTNREPKDINNLSKGYGNERAKKIHMGSCEVHVPKSHKIGEISGSLWEKLIHFDFSYGKVELKTIQPLTTDAFWSEISTLLSPLEEEEKQALIFIHGFNTSFDDAAIRATQLSVDLNHSGVTAFFSWASQAKALSYLSDEATIQYTEKYLTKFLTDFATKSGANRIHIVAHSMGNRALLEAVNRIQKENLNIKFGQIILAAPDVDADVFEELAEAYSIVSEQTTLYVSDKDKAVSLSKWIHAYNRVGFTPPVAVVNRINTIKIEGNVNLLELGHGYFASHKALLSDIYQLINFNLDANNRDYLIPKRVDNINNYWKLKSAD